MFNSGFKCKVDFYLSSGQVVTLKFEEFSAHKDSAWKLLGWSFKNPEHPWAISVDHVTALIIKNI